ncbi:MAG TPA: hypothetical protein VHZ31_07540 [Solirubrobacteraceae bacterium]|jgi:hypothetical protein|nr:hypothetical protein [Solirubrobacteraceae bacterium]
MAESLTGERERFLVGLIAGAFDAYERGDGGLARLVADVESGVEALFDVADREWVEQLRSAWSGLEIVYALALDEGRSAVTEEERGDVDETIAELCSLLAARASN